MRVWRTVLRILAAALCILFIFFGVLPLIEAGYQWYYGANSIYLITGTGIPILLSLVLFAILLWLFRQDGWKGYLKKENGEGIKANFSRRKKCIVGLLSCFLVIAGILVSMCWFQRFTLEGIEYHCLFYQKEYTWQNVSCLILKADVQGCLVFEFQMEDGTKRSFNGEWLWCVEYFSDGFEHQFPEDVYDYARWISKELGSRNIPLEAEDSWDSLMEHLEYDSWKVLAEDIRQYYENANKLQ